MVEKKKYLFRTHSTYLCSKTITIVLRLKQNNWIFRSTLPHMGRKSNVQKQVKVLVFKIQNVGNYKSNYMSIQFDCKSNYVRFVLVQTYPQSFLGTCTAFKKYFHLKRTWADFTEIILSLIIPIIGFNRIK